MLAAGAQQAAADSYAAQPTPLYYANDMQSPAVLFPVGGPAMAVARQIADKNWGFDPCGGNVALTWATAAPSVNATATWSNPTDAYANPQQNGQCSVAFNDQQAYDWPMLCTVFVHEFGHLTGHQHATDQNDVMFPYYTQPIAACSNTPNPQNPVAAPPPPAPAARTAHVTNTKQKKPVKHKRGRRARHRHHGGIRSHSLAPFSRSHVTSPHNPSRVHPRSMDASAARHTFHA